MAKPTFHRQKSYSMDEVSTIAFDHCPRCDLRVNIADETACPDCGLSVRASVKVTWKEYE